MSMRVLSSLLLVVASCWAEAPTIDSTVKNVNEMVQVIDAFNSTLAELIPNDTIVDLPTPPELRSLLQEMDTAPLLNQTIGIGGIDADDPRWFFNPFPWLKKKIMDKCKCTDHSCGCCFKLPFLDYDGCFGVNHVWSAKALRFNLGFDDKTVVTVNVGLKRVARQCGYLPTPFQFLNFCISERLDQLKDGTITICPALEVRYNQKVGASVVFRCVNYKGGHFTAGDVPTVDPYAIVTIFARDPFKRFVQFYKAHKPWGRH